MPPKPKSIPDGYHSITPGLIVRDAARAIEWYQKALGAKVRMRMDRPDGKVGHSELQIGSSILMLGDETPEMNKSPTTLNGTPVSFYLFVEDVDKAFDRAVKAGAKAMMPVTDMFWGDRMGHLIDPFGHLWNLATHKEDVPPEELDRRAKAFFAQMVQKPKG
ncbi:MAG: VOC family protein [Euryarchaeota archaeon]|nr:VOC family protein [Euryarchaeota archaeon]